MMIPKRFRFVGGRIVKTGIAVFVTALICNLLDWPAMFAVIAAIVTIEPTAANSIQKAYVRFPATAIGAAFSVLYTFLFGDSPLSYAFVSLSTIIACYKLKLHDGTLVATLTGVAMISTVQDHYIASFFIRLGTTSIGLIVSTLVNLLVMPPNYTETIASKVHTLFTKAGKILSTRGKEISHEQVNHKQLRQDFQMLVTEIEKIEVLFKYQKSEWKFHRFNRKEIRRFHYEYKKFNILRQVAFHIGNLIFLPTYFFHLEKDKNEIMTNMIQTLEYILSSEHNTINDECHIIITEIREWFWKQKSFIDKEKSLDQHHHILPETAILYELLSIYDLTEELNQIHGHEIRHQQPVKAKM